MKRISISELIEKTKDAISAEMNVNGIIRGGHFVNNKFYYCGSRSHGCIECEINETLKVRIS
jgi:hypothetical protein